MIIEISQAAYEGHFVWVARALLGDDRRAGIISNTSDSENNPVDYAISLRNPTENERSLVETAATLYAPTLTFTVDAGAGTVTLDQALTARCYLWFDNDLQPGQDDFTPGDLVLDGLNAPGAYRVLALNTATGQSAFTELEVE